MASTNFEKYEFADRYSAAWARLYGPSVDTARQRERWGSLAERHVAVFGKVPLLVFSSPGRIELLGNHTDHQHGKVLTASIQLDTLATVGEREGEISIQSGEYPMIRVRLDSPGLLPKEVGTSTAIVKGILAYLVEHGYRVGGFVATMTSDVGRGSGVSSSASFECCVVEILNCLYNGGKISPIEKARAAWWAETKYFGKPCGMLDQCAIALGGVSYIDFADPSAPVVEKLNLAMQESFLLLNTGGDHTQLTHCYADIRKEMESVAEALGGKVLHDVEKEADPVGRALRAGCSGRAVARAVHYVEENKRVEKARAAVKEGNADELATLMEASGDSSWKLLQNLYVPGEATQLIPAALCWMGALGAKAKRVHGGGFAGTVLALFGEGKLENAEKALAEHYGRENLQRVWIRPDGACEVLV